MSFLLSACRWLCRIPWSSAPIAIWNDEGCALFCCSCQVRGLLLLHDPFWALFVISMSNSHWWLWVFFGFVLVARYCTFLVIILHSLQLGDLGDQLNAEEPNRMMHSSKYSSDFFLRCSRSLDLSFCSQMALQASLPCSMHHPFVRPHAWENSLTIRLITSTSQHVRHNRIWRSFVNHISIYLNELGTSPWPICCSGCSSLDLLPAARAGWGSYSKRLESS